MTGRRLAFWGAVAGVSIGANFLLATVVARNAKSAHPIPGLAIFAAATHGGSA